MPECLLQLCADSFVLRPHPQGKGSDHFQVISWASVLKNQTFTNPNSLVPVGLREYWQRQRFSLKLGIDNSVNPQPSIHMQEKYTNMSVRCVCVTCRTKTAVFPCCLLQVTVSNWVEHTVLTGITEPKGVALYFPSSRESTHLEKSVLWAIFCTTFFRAHGILGLIEGTNLHIIYRCRCVYVWYIHCYQQPICLVHYA